MRLPTRGRKVTSRPPGTRHMTCMDRTPHMMTMEGTGTPTILLMSRPWSLLHGSSLYSLRLYCFWLPYLYPDLSSAPSLPAPPLRLLLTRARAGERVLKVAVENRLHPPKAQPRLNIQQLKR